MRGMCNLCNSVRYRRWRFERRLALFFHVLPLSGSCSLGDGLAEEGHEFTIAMEAESAIRLLKKEGDPGVLVTCESGVCA